MFQVEVVAICETARQDMPRSMTVLFSDRNEALGALTVIITNSKLVRKCLNSLADRQTGEIEIGVR